MQAQRQANWLPIFMIALAAAIVFAGALIVDDQRYAAAHEDPFAFYQCYRFEGSSFQAHFFRTTTLPEDRTVQDTCDPFDAHGQQLQRRFAPHFTAWYWTPGTGLREVLPP